VRQPRTEINKRLDRNISRTKAFEEHLAGRAQLRCAGQTESKSVITARSAVQILRVGANLPVLDQDLKFVDDALDFFQVFAAGFIGPDL
jgi:hypothetical protein